MHYFMFIAKSTAWTIVVYTLLYVHYAKHHLQNCPVYIIICRTTSIM